MAAVSKCLPNFVSPVTINETKTYENSYQVNVTGNTFRMCNLSSKIRFDPLLNDEMYDTKTFIHKVTCSCSSFGVSGLSRWAGVSGDRKIFCPRIGFSVLAGVINVALNK